MDKEIKKNYRIIVYMVLLFITLLICGYYLRENWNDSMDYQEKHNGKNPAQVRYSCDKACLYLDIEKRSLCRMNCLEEFNLAIFGSVYG